MKKNLDELLALFALGVGFLILLIFGVFRLYKDEYFIASVDLALAFAVSLIFMQYWKHGHSKRINLIFVISYMVGILALMLTRATDLVYWIYPIIAITFFLLHVRTALFLNIVIIVSSLSVLLYNTAFTSIYISIAATMVLLCVFIYVFSAREEFHKKELKMLATQDSLTNTGNRRSLDNCLDQVVTAFNNDAIPHTIIMLDLDHFKKVNDIYGHSVGDEVLIEFTNILKQNISDNDCIYRYGGEEFVVVSKNSTLRTSARLAEKIRKSVETQLLANNEKTITVSVGVSELMIGDEPITWLSRADDALYKAKKASRNLVVLIRKNKNGKLAYKPLIAKASTKIKTVALRHQNDIKPSLNSSRLPNTASAPDMKLL